MLLGSSPRLSTNFTGCIVKGRRPALEAGGCGFEIHHPDQINININRDLLMLKFKEYVTERKESDVTQDELESIFDSMKFIISKGRRSNNNAADLWHDVIMKGKGLDWFNDVILPEYEKAKYPRFGSPEYGKWERDITKKYIRK
jgi:hypothetical protein